MRGRVGATFHVMGGGMAVAGALIRGFLGGMIGSRAALYVAAGGLLIRPAVAAFSGLMRDQPDQAYYLFGSVVDAHDFLLGLVGLMAVSRERVASAISVPSVMGKRVKGEALQFLDHESGISASGRFASSA
jgi:hypothetical protein